MERVVIDKKRMHGKPIIKGTRVPVETILGALVSGMTYDEICREYGVKKADILAAIEYAYSVVSNEEIGFFKTVKA